MVVEAPHRLLLLPDTLYLYPSEGGHGFAAWRKAPNKCSPDIEMGVVIPPGVKTTRFSYVNAELEVKSPTILWTLSLVSVPLHGQTADNVPCECSFCTRSYTFEYHVYQLKVENNKVLRKPYRIGNVNVEGRICWNGGYPSNLREAHNTFWRREFTSAYCQAFHDCPNYSSPYPASKYSCPATARCKCCSSCCLCYSQSGPKYRAYVENYTGDKDVVPWEDYEAILKEWPNKTFRESPQALHISKFDKNDGLKLTWLEKDLEKGWLKPDVGETVATFNYAVNHG